MPGMSPQARDLVIRTILGEADPSPEGQAAVANVILNRANSGVWGDPYNGGLTNTIKAKQQFSTWNQDPKMQAHAASINAIPTTDPRYQRAGQIADAVWSGQYADNTGGATHFYAPNAIPTPDWAKGQQGRIIGTQNFYKLPLTAANTAGTGVTGPSSAPPPGPNPADAEDARAFLSSLSAHTDRAGDTANLNPEFATRLAAAIKQARTEGMPISVMSAFREPGQTGSAYDAGGNSSHSYGLAVDVAGLDGPNGKITQRWAQIAQANGLSNPYGVGNGAEFNHWQLPPVPLEQTPQLLASLKAAKASGNFANVWAAYQPTGEAARAGPYMPTGEVEANKPALQAQPVAAVAPPGSAPIPGNGQNPPAGSPGASDPNARFQVLQTMGQGGRPGLPYTALNLTPGAGASTPAPTPAPVTPAPQSVPLDQTPQPPPRPPGLGYGVNQGVLTANPPTPPPRPPDLTATMPTPTPTPMASMPSPVLASAQNLLKLLFPTG